MSRIEEALIAYKLGLEDKEDMAYIIAFIAVKLGVYSVLIAGVAAIVALVFKFIL